MTTPISDEQGDPLGNITQLQPGDRVLVALRHSTNDLALSLVLARLQAEMPDVHFVVVPEASAVVVPGPA